MASSDVGHVGEKNDGGRGPGGHRRDAGSKGRVLAGRVIGVADGDGAEAGELPLRAVRFVAENDDHRIEARPEAPARTTRRSRVSPSTRRKSLFSPMRVDAPAARTTPARIPDRSARTAATISPGSSRRTIPKAKGRTLGPPFSVRRSTRRPQEGLSPLSGFS